MALLNVDELFQTLFSVGLPDIEVASDLDTDSFDLIPFLTHQSVIAQMPSGRGAWQVTLTVNLFLEPDTAFDRTAQVYDLVHSWGEAPQAGMVANLGVVTQLEDLNAFSAVSGEVDMLNKVVRHYQAQFSILARILPV